MPRAHRDPLAELVKHLQDMIDDLSAAKGGDTPTTRALAQHIKRDIASLCRAVKRQQAIHRASSDRVIHRAVH